jgi:uncharacterized membrane protein
VDIIIVRRVRPSPARAVLLLGLASGAGAGMAYLLDPASGRRRRALLEDQWVHSRHLAEDLIGRAAVDLRNRTVGLVAEAQSHLRHGPVDDRVLGERVRSALGRHLTHPGAIQVAAHDGVVTLSGPILQREARKALLAARRVAGVHEVDDRLERHRAAEDVAALRGAGRAVPHPVLRQEHWPPALQMLGGVAGAAMVARSVAMRGPVAMVGAGAGLILLARAVSNLPLKRIVGIGAGRRAIDVRKDIHIARPPEEVFAHCRNFEALPQFMSHVRSVRQVGDNRFHWEARGPAGIAVHWDAEITRMEDDHLLAWKSTPDSHLEQAGVLRVDPENGGTRLQVRMTYNPLGGAMGHAVASLFGADPKHALDDDLLRLKSLLETGKATAHGRTVTREQVEPPRGGE